MATSLLTRLISTSRVFQSTQLRRLAPSMIAALSLRAARGFAQCQDRQGIGCRRLANLGFMRPAPGALPFQVSRRRMSHPEQPTADRLSLLDRRGFPVQNQE